MFGDSVAPGYGRMHIASISSSNLRKRKAEEGDEQRLCCSRKSCCSRSVSA